MTNLFDMNQRLNQWQGEKTTGDWATELRLKNGDLVFFQFVANGDEGDRFIKAYRAHQVPTTYKNGQKGSIIRYCPTANGEPGECPYCQQGITDMKERMSMWLYVANILHTQMPADKQFPQIQYQNKFYFNEEVKGFKIWHNSAWRESPWVDIMKLYELHQGLHNFTAELDCLGDGTARRYKLYAISQNALDPAIYEQARGELKPIGDLLREQMSSNVVVAPAPATGSPVGQVVQPFAPPGANAAPAFTPLFTAPVPTQSAPPQGAAGLVAAPSMPAATDGGSSPAQGIDFSKLTLPTNGTTQETVTPTSAAQPSTPSAPPPAPVQEMIEENAPLAPVEQDARRPLQSLF